MVRSSGRGLCWQQVCNERFQGWDTSERYGQIRFDFIDKSQNIGFSIEKNKKGAARNMILTMTR